MSVVRTKPLKDQSGFSLVQVLVAVGIMGGLALAMMQMTDNQIKVQKTMELKAEQGDVANVIRQVLRDAEACAASFVGMSPGDKINAIRMSTDMSQPPFAQTGEKFKNYNVYIKDMYLLTRKEEEDYGLRKSGEKPIASYTTGSGYAYLRVTFTKNPGKVSDENQRKNFYGGKDTAEIFPVKGFFYDTEIVTHNDQNKLNEACWAKATARGVSCNGSPSEPCAVTTIDEDGVAGADFIVDQATGTQLYLGHCRFFRDNSPFMECAH